MNYIPGFSNYLETSVPRYADGGAVMDPLRQAAVMPMAMRAAPAENVYQSAVAPMTTAAAPFDLSKVNISGLGGFGGGRMGGVIENPNQQYITAPISNKGNPTGKAAGNYFTMTPDQSVRLVDHRTNQVVFEGTGYDAARKATQLGQALTDQYGRKANYSIQTANPTGDYTTVAYEKRNKSTLGKIGDVVGTLAPIAAAIATGGMSLPAQMAIAAGAGGLGAALKGDNILKGALLGGATAGVVGGTGLDKAIGGVLGNVGKGAAQVGGKAAADVTGDIVVTGLSKALQGAGGALGQAALSQAGKTGLGEITGYKTPSEQFVQQPAPPAFKPPVDLYAGIDPIVVTGGGSTTGLGGLTGLGNGVVASLPALGGLASDPFLSQPLPQQQPTTTEPAPEEEIVVSGNRPVPPTVTQDYGIAGSVLQGLPALGGLTSDPNLVNYDEPYASDEIVVTGNVPTVTQDLGLGSALAGLPVAIGGLYMDPALTAETPPGKKLGVEDYLSIAGKGLGLLGGLAGGGGSGQAGTYTRGGLNPIFSAKLPTANIPGGVGAASNLGVRPMDEQDWLTYAERPEQSFYNYVPQPTGMAEGGALPAKHGGSPDRTEFAVNGPGTGRSDDIPAVLSDGEYVIDAETVALLGDGSSKAGAKKLDDLRVKVRKHKGQKLAKGRFSANAKKPEAYLSGGRI